MIVNIKKIFVLFIFFLLFAQTFVCAENVYEVKQKETRAKINKLKWLENVETNKLYKNQQRLERATSDLSQSKNQIAKAQSQLNDIRRQLDVASSEYNNLNSVLVEHIRRMYKHQRGAFFEILLSSEDINTFVDRIYYKKVILREDYDRMTAARNKAIEIAQLKYDIESRKKSLERSAASINSQQTYIQQAIAKNENMIHKLRTDRAAYEKAERELARQSEQIGNYITKATKTTDTVAVSGFIKPIGGRITSPFGERIHPIFKSRTFHSGVDIGGPNLGAIRASNSGKVIFTGWYGGYGKVVIIEHGIINGKPMTTLYAHMSSIAVANGQKVTKGQVLGYEGTTGYSTGPHCHFEVRVNGKPNNPLNYI